MMMYACMWMTDMISVFTKYVKTGTKCVKTDLSSDMVITVMFVHQLSNTQFVIIFKVEAHCVHELSQESRNIKSIFKYICINCKKKMLQYHNIHLFV